MGEAETAAAAIGQDVVSAEGRIRIVEAKTVFSDVRDEDVAREHVRCAGTGLRSAAQIGPAGCDLQVREAILFDHVKIRARTGGKRRIVRSEP